MLRCLSSFAARVPAAVVGATSARVLAVAMANSRRMGTAAQIEKNAVARLTRVMEQCRSAMASISAADRLQSVDPKAVFCNRELGLADIDVIGFDFDFTIANYKPALQTLIYELARDYMVAEGYKEQLNQLSYDPSFAIRGLAFDRRTGMLLKLDPSMYLDDSCVFRGRVRQTRAQVRALYGRSFHLSQSYAERNLRIMQDLFCLPEATLLADIVDTYDKLEIPFEPQHVYDDVRSALEAVHSGRGRDGGLHRCVAGELAKYLDTDTSIFKILTELRAAGKRTMLITNSAHDFVNAGMSHLLDASHSEYADGAHWSSFFDVIICKAAKPHFYTADRPLRRLDPLTGRLTWDRVKSFRPGDIHVGGNVAVLHELMRVTPERVLYFGDNLPADLVAPSRSHSWRTGAIVHELEREIGIENSDAFFVSSMRLRQIKAALAQIAAISTTVPAHCQTFFDTALAELKEEHRAEELAAARLFNAQFGSTFRCRDYVSSFGATVQRWSDVYASRVDLMLNYGSAHTFYPRPQRMQHEMPIAHPSQFP